MVLLWSDLCLFMVVLLALWCWRTCRVAPAWVQIQYQFAQSRVATVACIVLLMYVVVALIDSLHFHHVDAQGVPAVASALDGLLHFLGERLEQSYSAPFAQQAFAYSFDMQPSGQQVWQQAPLRHVDLAGQSTLAWLMGGYALWSSAIAALLIGVVQGARWLQRCCQSKAQPCCMATWLGAPGSCERCVVVTAFVLLLLVFWLGGMAQHLHVLGTDKVGVDVFYKVCKSVRTGLIIGSVTTLLMLPFALLCGCTAGYLGGRVDDVVQYIYTTISAIPSVLLIAAVILVLQAAMPSMSMVWQADLRLVVLCAILGLTSWTGLCRLLRGETLKLREMTYIDAARVSGVSSRDIIRRHIIPNVMHLVLLAAVIDFSGLVLAEAVLSYVGIGVDPTTHSWGTMINSARLELAREPVVWWPLVAAFVSMLGLVLPANVVAETMRQALDPRQHDLDLEIPS